MTAFAYHVDGNLRPLETDIETTLAEIRLANQEHRDTIQFHVDKER